MAAKILEDFLKSINFEKEDQVAPLAKSVSEGEASIENMLSKIDETSDLTKMSNIPELADEKAKKEAADHTDTVFSVEATKEEVGANTDSSHNKESEIKENADIKAKKEAAENTDTVFSVEKVIDTNGVSEPKRAEVTRPNSANKSDSNHSEKPDLIKKEESEEEEDDEEDNGKEIMKKSEDVDWFDASEPLKQLAKSMDIMSQSIKSLTSRIDAQDATTKELFKSIATVSVKGFQLQKSIAGALDSISEKPNAPKGMLNILHKSFEQNGNGGDGQAEVRPGEFSDMLIKGIQNQVISGKDAENFISKVDVQGFVDDGSLQVYNLCKKRMS